VVARGAFTESILKGGRNGNGIGMLWQHNATMPVGLWSSLIENDRGLKAEGQLEMELSMTKDIHVMLKRGLVKGLSIGFNIPGKDAYDIDPKTRVRTIKKAELWEISLVTFPANVRANITHIKALVEGAKTERQMEEALRDVGLSKSAAQYLVSLLDKSKLGEPEREAAGDQGMGGLLTALKQVNADLSIKRLRI
jgi:hypothetical protein